MQSFSRVAYTDRMRSPAILALILALLIAVGSPAAALEGLREGERGRVVEVIDADTVILDSGLSVRLVGIQAPKLPLGREGFVAWPLAAEAKAALEEMVLEQSVGLFYGGLETDRYGRALAHLVRDDGLWLQGELLARGWARVYGFRDNRAKLPEMLALEAEARAEKRGIWAEPFYRVVTVDETEAHLGSFQLVEGRVLDVAVVKGRGYLNFGPDWRTDFTVSIAPADLRAFEAEGFDIAGLEGRFIRVRGWLKFFNGPMIDATHPEQVEDVK